jgi:hypothetical protein
LLYFLLYPSADHPVAWAAPCRADPCAARGLTTLGTVKAMATWEYGRLVYDTSEIEYDPTAAGWMLYTAKVKTAVHDLSVLRSRSRRPALTPL